MLLPDMPRADITTQPSFSSVGKDAASGVNRVAGSRVIGAQAMERNLT